MKREGSEHLNDHDIITLFFERSEQAVAELIFKYESDVKSIVFHVLRDEKDVEECVNDAWLQIWNTIPPARPDSLCAYVCRIAKNISLNRYHANTAKKRNSIYDAALDELENNVPALASVESEYDAKELTEHLNRFLKKLSYDDRYLFLRRYWFGDAVSEIAERMHISTNAASIRLYRIRRKLQGFLKREGMME